MRRQQKVYPYVLLALSLFCLLNFSHQTAQRWRLFASEIASPLWRVCFYGKEQAALLLSFSWNPKRETEAFLKKAEQLQRENQALRIELDHLHEWVTSEDRVEEQMLRLKAMEQEKLSGTWEESLQRRRKLLAQVLKMQSKGILAKVVYRDPACWSSFLWLDVGERENQKLKETVIAKNSPVVVGNALVGVVEEVYASRSKVRLITDANLTPSVRALRGGRQDRLLLQKAEALSQMMQTRKDLFPSQEEESMFFSLLSKVTLSLTKSLKDEYLAKGELFGSSLPLWRARGQFLKGVGFNYDFADEEGPARDLRTGERLLDLHHRERLVLLREGDLLVTTGFDGVFPEGLEVAIVHQVYPLREGAFSYEIEARAVCENLDELRRVTILPPIEYEEEI